MSRENLSPAWGIAFDLDLDHAEGCYIYDAKGKRYLDFTSGIGVTNTGHSHPRIVKAIQEQAAKMLHAQMGVGKGKAVLELTEELKQILPKELDTYFFSNSGAEAVEAAVKLAKSATGRTNIITFDGSFHGRSHLTMAMTNSKYTYREHMQPLPSGIFVSPYANCWECPVAKHTMSAVERSALSASCPDDGGKCCGYAEDALHHLFKTISSPHDTAAIILEPELGEGGYVAPPARFLRELRKLCTEHGMMLIFDEIQTGFGRTGKWWAAEHYGIVPDAVIMAKGIASGMPLSGVASRRELMAKWPPGSHGGTYGPNIVSAAAAVETIRVLREEKILENAAARGAQLKQGLQELQKDFKQVGDVRGLGLMIGTAFVKPDGQPDAEFQKKVNAYCFEHDLLMLSCGTYGNIIRWIPPLVVSKEQIDHALKIFAAALDACG